MHNTLQSWLEAKSTSHTHRQLVVISGVEEWATARASEIVSQLKYENCLTVDVNLNKESLKNEASTTTHTNNTNYRQYLGQEFDCLIYNAFQGFRANSVMALCGTVKSSGLMLLLCPELDKWALFNDPERVKRTSYGFDITKQPSAFINWLNSHIEEMNPCALLTPDSFTGSVAINPYPKGFSGSKGRTSDQEQAIQHIIKVVTGHRRRPLVISADRGRGKTSVLGMATAELLKGRCTKIIITAPNIKACEQAFYHAQQALADSTRDKSTLTLEDKCLAFLPPDAILKTKPRSDLLLIDEAAAIPTPLLKQLLAQYSRIVFSTTIQGYEGSGRGFEIRFKKHLDESTPNWQSFQLTDPIRWSKGDPLETFWFNTFLMKEEAKKACTIKTPLCHENLAFTVLSGKDLIKQPKILAPLFSLLLNAHYQTVPDDLQRLLDSPDHAVLIAIHQENIVGAVLFINEPNYLGQLTTEIHRGKRRVNGHLLSQSLCFHAGLEQATELTYFRTIRIAVDPLYQNQGIGTELLQQLQNEAQERQVDMLGTSFGLENKLLCFWQKNDYQLLRIGYQKDASSGELSGLMMCPISPKATKLSQQAKHAYSTEFAYQLSSRLIELPHQLIITALNQFNYPVIPAATLAIVEHFSRGERPLELAEHHLHVFLLNRLSNHQQTKKNLTSTECEALVSYCLQRRSVDTVCNRVGLTGKKQLKATIVSAIGKLL